MVAFGKIQTVDITAYLQYEKVSDSIYFSNFIEFDAKSTKAMLLLVQVASARPMKMRTVTFVEVELSLISFLKVRKWIRFYNRETVGGP